MNKNFNELYNRFIDNELSNEEEINISSLTKINDEFNVGLQTHKFVHNSLFSLPVVQAPLEVTSKIMGKIVSNISTKYEKHLFFRVILAILGLSFLGTLAMFISYSLSFQNSSEIFDLLDSIKPHTKKIIPQLSKIIKSDLAKWIGGLISFIILLAFYFSINEHKRFRERLKEF